MNNIKYFNTLAETISYGSVEIKTVNVEKNFQYILIGTAKNGRIHNPTLNIIKIINGKKMYSQTIINFGYNDLLKQLIISGYKPHTNFSVCEGHVEAIETWGLSK